MENTIKEITRLLLQGTLTKDEADKILFDLLDVSGRSEQLIDFAIKNGYFKDIPKGQKDGLIYRFEKSIGWVYDHF
jgi:hypothetical protein